MVGGIYCQTSCGSIKNLKIGPRMIFEREGEKGEERFAHYDVNPLSFLSGGKDNREGSF